MEIHKNKNVGFKAACDLFKYFIAIVHFLCAILFIISSLPVYIFRLFAKPLAKWLRPDLGDMLDPTSSMLSNDYFSGRAPRSNLIVSVTYQGNLTSEQVKRRVFDLWIKSRDPVTGHELFPQFRQYPVRWMGFMFWKTAEHFSMNNHFEYTTGILTEKQFDLKIEALLNGPLPKGQSPWKIHFVENYQCPENPEQHHCVIILQYHHCLADGMAIQMALLKICMNSFSPENYKLPNIQNPKRKNILMQIITYPIVVLYYFSKIFLYVQQNSFFKVQDQNKKWHQVYAKSEPITIQSIKDTKNRLGVSFTSVILSAISSATAKYLEEKRRPETKIPFVSVIPIPGVDRLKYRLTNFVTAALFELPVNRDMTAMERLQQCHDLLQNVRNTAPMVSHYICLLRGCHFYWGSEILNNTAFPYGMTNVAVTPEVIEIGNAKCVEVLSIVGSLQGVMGAGFTVNSHGDQVRIQLAAEEAIISRDDAKSFVKQVANEIKALNSLAFSQ